MNIGPKLKQARANVHLTQEQVAEALGVSRQTISNWENEKTYPDIVSVVKLSDLYRVSLDHLLKEEQNMSDSGYLTYLEESTDTVRSNDRKGKTVLVCVYLAIWAFAILVFWFFTGESDAMGYSLMFLWVLLPVTTFVFSLLIGVRNDWGRRKWGAAIVFGVLYMLAEYATFSAANMATFHQFVLPEFGMIFAGAVISAIGLGIGSLIRRARGKRGK